MQDFLKKNYVFMLRYIRKHYTTSLILLQGVVQGWLYTLNVSSVDMYWLNI